MGQGEGQDNLRSLRTDAIAEMFNIDLGRLHIRTLEECYGLYNSHTYTSGGSIQIHGV